MIYKATKEELLLAVRRMSYNRADSLPLTFKLGDRVIRGIPADFAPTTRKRLIDSNMTETTITGIKDGLEITAEVIEYRDLPVTEYTVYFTNRGTEPTEILSEINAIDADFCGEAPVLQHGNGDDCSGNGYKFFETAITRDPFTIAPRDDGTSCAGAYPFMRVKFEDYILTAAIGWTGTWKATFTANEMGINMKAGQKYCNFRILPGETMRTPLICLMITETACEDRAINMWRKFYNKHIMPKQWGETPSPKLCAHVWNYHGNEFTGATEDSQITGLRRYIRRGIKPDVWWYDAGFYPCGGDWGGNVGNWREDPVRWPNNGLGPLGEECERNGTDLMVWFEPERCCRGTELHAEHPEFLLSEHDEQGHSTFNHYFNLGDPVARAWMVERIDAFIKKWKIKIYRQDFNFVTIPFSYWRETEGTERVGAVENLCVQGYYAFWDELLLRNPGLLIDSCAGGGRRNDLETLRRSVSFQYTDVGCADPAQKEKQHLMLFEWMPFFRAHTFSAPPSTFVDEFTWLTAFAPAVTFTPPCWGEEEAFAVARRMLPIWRRAADLMLRGDYYRQMKINYDAELTSFFCTHFYDPEKGDGFVLFLRNKDCAQEAFAARLAVEEGYDYLVENAMTGEKQVMAAKDLAHFTVRLEKHEGTVFFLTRLR